MSESGHDPDLTRKLISLIDGISDEKKQQLLNLLVEWRQGEKRGDDRIPCLIPVDFSTQDRVYRDFIHNLSNGGVFIESREPFTKGQSVSLTFSAPNSQSHFKITGSIVRTEEKGIAVQFSKKLSKYQEQIIKGNADLK
jgi:Tfp pilus assembly protein PilZ